MGSLCNMYSGVFWASWGGSGKEPISRNRLPMTLLLNPSSPSTSAWQVLRFRGTSSGNRIRVCSEVWTELALGTRFRKPEVLRRFRVPEIPFPRFRKLLFTLKGHFCTLKVYFVNWKSTFVLWKYSCVLWKYAFVFWKFTLYFETILLFFETILLYFDTSLL